MKRNLILREGELIIEPEELAREICLLSFENYSQLTPQDLKKMIEEGNSTANPLRKFSNHLSKMVTTLVLLSSNRNTFPFFVQVAIELTKLNNLSGLVAIVTGLNFNFVLKEMRKRGVVCLFPHQTRIFEEIEDMALDPLKLKEFLLNGNENGNENDGDGDGDDSIPLVPYIAKDCFDTKCSSPRREKSIKETLKYRMPYPFESDSNLRQWILDFEPLDPFQLENYFASLSFSLSRDKILH